MGLEVPLEEPQINPDKKRHGPRPLDPSADSLEVGVGQSGCKVAFGPQNLCSSAFICGLPLHRCGLAPGTADRDQVYPPGRTCWYAFLQQPGTVSTPAPDLSNGSTGSSVRLGSTAAGASGFTQSNALSRSRKDGLAHERTRNGSKVAKVTATRSSPMPRNSAYSTLPGEAIR